MTLTAGSLVVTEGIEPPHSGLQPDALPTELSYLSCERGTTNTPISHLTDDGSTMVFELIRSGASGIRTHDLLRAMQALSH